MSRRNPDTPRALTDAEVRRYRALADRLARRWGVEAGWAQEEDRKKAEEFLAWVREAPATIRVYRAVRLHRPSDLRLEGIGTWWAWDRSGADTYMAGEQEGDVYILVGEVSARDVVWQPADNSGTFFKNLYDAPWEREIELWEGAPVRLLSMFLVVNGRDLTRVNELERLNLPEPIVAKANPRHRNPDPTVEIYRDRQGEVSSVKVRLAGGEVSAIRPDPAEREMYVGWSGLPENERGKGLGIRMYAALMDWALENDFILTSDESVSREAGRVWEALARRGYPIRKHPEARTITEGDIGAWYAHGRKPPFLLHRRNPRRGYTSAMRTDPELWEEVKAEVTRGSKGGKPGQWSARKAQLAVALYKQRGGDYYGPKSPYNALAKWTREKWRTKSGRPSLETGERYLPSAAIAALTPAEYAATTRAKRAGMKKGQQFVPQPETVAKKVRRYRRNPSALYPDIPDRAPRTAAFKRWFGGSKVVDRRGKPLVVFHGSRRPFAAFDYSRWGQTDPGFAGKGFYFIDHMGWAKAYAETDAQPTDQPTVVAVYLRMENPLIVRGFDEIPGATGRVPTREQAEEMQRRVRALGYDGIVVKGKPGNPSEYVVFEPSQVKSVDNIGTFDRADPDIRRNPAQGYVFYHGAQRWEGPPQIVAHRKGHAEHGPGIYLTTAWQTAVKYAKGGGAVYRIELSPETRWLEGARLPLAETVAWVRGLPRLRGKADIVDTLSRTAERIGGSTLPAFVLVNAFVNRDVASGQHGPSLAAYLVAHGIDASLVQQGAEDWVVVFNPDIVRSVRRVSAAEVSAEGFAFDLPRVRNPVQNVKDENVHLKGAYGSAEDVFLKMVQEQFAENADLFFGLPEGSAQRTLRTAARRVLRAFGIDPKARAYGIDFLTIEERGKGSGSRIVGEIEQTLRNEGEEVVFLIAAQLFVDVPHSRGFWKRMGYTEVPGNYEPLMWEFGSVVEDDRIMFKML